MFDKAMVQSIAADPKKRINILQSFNIFLICLNESKSFIFTHKLRMSKRKMHEANCITHRFPTLL